MNSSILDVFDSWEPMLKARKAKGLDKWSKLANISDKLKGKGVEHIKFTCCHPSHGEKTTHTLGSVMGNLHFLLGYGNPGFGVMPYHYQVIDPLLEDDGAEVIFKKLGNPSNPTFWRAAGLEVFPEGEAEGSAHKEAAPMVKQQRSKAGKPVVSGYGTYKMQPAEARVYDSQRDTHYRWSLVKDSFFASSNPEVSAVMNKASEKRVVPESTTIDIPDVVKHLQKSVEAPWGTNVYPFVKSLFPAPGSVVPVTANDGSTIYGVVNPTAIVFHNKNGNLVDINVYDYAYKFFDLEKGGSIHPAILVSFAKAQLGIDTDSYMSLFEPADIEESDFPAKVYED